MRRLRCASLAVCAFLIGCGPRERAPEAADTTRRVRAVAADSVPTTPPLIEILAGPTFTAFTVPPELLNRDEVLRSRDREYPPQLREDGVGGTVHIWFLLDDQGRVLSRVIAESSGIAELDAAGLRVAQVYRFSPAMNRDRPVYVWVALPIQFE